MPETRKTREEPKPVDLFLMDDWLAAEKHPLKELDNTKKKINIISNDDGENLLLLLFFSITLKSVSRIQLKKAKESSKIETETNKEESLRVWRAKSATTVATERLEVFGSRENWYISCEIWIKFEWEWDLMEEETEGDYKTKKDREGE